MPRCTAIRRPRTRWPASEPRSRTNLKALDEVDRRLTVGGKITEELGALRTVCLDLLKKAPSLSEDESFARHSSATAGLITLIARVGDVTNLTHDPDIDRKRLIDVLVFQGPELSESLSRARGFGLGVAESKTRTVEQVERLTRDAVLVEFLAAKLDESMAMALEANGALRPELEAHANTTSDLVLEAMAEVAKLARGGTMDREPDGVFHGADRERGLDLRARTAHRDVAHRIAERASGGAAPRSPANPGVGRVRPAGGVGHRPSTSCATSRSRSVISSTAPTGLRLAT